MTSLFEAALGAVLNQKVSAPSPPEEFSLVTAPYGIEGEIVGTVGVIGPRRMSYERIIPIVDITAKLLSNGLSQH